MGDGTFDGTFFLPHVPCAPLGRFIQFIWIARGMQAHKRERVLPNGVIELIVNLGSPHKVLERDDYAREALYRDCWVAGIQNRHLVIEAVRETDLVGIRFRPGGAYPFLGFPLSELTDQVIELDLIDRAFLADLRAPLLEARNDLERIACVERFLLRRLDVARAGHGAVQFVCEQIRATDGAVRIADLVARTGISHRRLVGNFERDVGMTPKGLARTEHPGVNFLQDLRTGTFVVCPPHNSIR